MSAPRDVLSGKARKRLSERSEIPREVEMSGNPMVVETSGNPEEV